MSQHSYKMSRQFSTAIYLNQCRDIVRNIETKFCLMIPTMSQHSLLCCSIYHSIILILCYNKVVKFRDNIHLLLESSFFFVATYHFLLRYSFAGYLEIMSRHSKIMSRHFCLSPFFSSFLAGFASFAFKTFKTPIW